MIRLEQNTKNEKTLKIIAIAIPLAVAVLIGVPQKIDLGSWTKILPHVIGFLNASTSFTLLFGYYAIKYQKNIANHRKAMGLSFVQGALFLLIYILYHISNPSTVYQGQGFIRYVYYFLLISHILLSVGVVWFVLKTVFYALTNQIEAHKKMAKITFPIWLYVSVSGVIVYLMISPYYV